MHPVSGHVPNGRSEPRGVQPGEHPFWDVALALVNRDLAATVPEQGPLRLRALPSQRAGVSEDVYVALADGEWHGNPLYPDSADDAVQALAAVVDAAQDTVTERLWRAWPLCAEHDLGMHPRDDADGRISWWCAGERSSPGSAHIHAAVGAIDAFNRPRRPDRRRRKVN
jgi:hypothetical protein